MDTEETIWVTEDDAWGVDVTLNPPPFSAARAALGYAKQEAYAGMGLYIAFNSDNNAEYVVLRTDMAHMLDGFRVR